MHYYIFINTNWYNQKFYQFLEGSLIMILKIFHNDGTKTVLKRSTIMVLKRFPNDDTE